MAQSARLRTVSLDQPPTESPFDAPKDVDIGKLADGVTMKDGVLTVEQPNGDVIVNFNPDLTEKTKSGDWDDNLALRLGEDELAKISSELLQAIQQDDDSRKEWLATRARGIELLGIKLDEPRGESSEGTVSSVRHPVLLEAVLRFQANARSELLPSSGPVKVRNDTTARPEQPKPAPGTGGSQPPPGMAPPMAPMPVMPQGPSPVLPGGAEEDPAYQETEELAEALERDLNHYLTVDAPEYYPDTDRMLFSVGFGGLGIKKVYNCPLRRRPVSESVDPSDLIVSNAATDLKNAGRITHVIKMRPSVLKRMQIVGAYRDIDLQLAQTNESPNPFEQAEMEQQGIQLQTSIPQMEDIDQVIYESYCELDIPGYEHKDDGEKTGLRCPYKVSIHKESRKVLEIRRNWEEKDKLCEPLEFFVDFPFVVTQMGFYPIGLLHILGNATSALTAAWRMILDSGMFGTFPGFLYAKHAGRQLTNNFRISPGSGLPVETGGGRIQDAVMPLPYKEAGPSFVNFIENVGEVAQRLGGTPDATVGESKQDVPVGTTLALIEQTTKLMDAVHKRLHSAQAKEFRLLKERFKEDPPAFWRHNKNPTIKWKKDQFLKALNNNELTPVADPNNPTSLHRIAKATAIKELQKLSPELYDPMAVDKRIFRIVGIDPEGLFRATPAPAPADPRMEAVKSKERIAQMQAQTQIQVAGVKGQEKQMDAQNKARESQQKMELSKQEAEQDRRHMEQEHQLEVQKMLMEMKLEMQKMQMELQKTKAEMHMKHQQSQMELQHDMQRGQQEMQMAERQSNMELQQQDRQMQMDQRSQEQSLQAEQQKHQMGIQAEREKSQNQMSMQREKHSMGMEQAREKHNMGMQQTKAQGQAKIQQSDALNKQKVATAKAVAKAKGGKV